jgi:hypothetical protein
MRVTRSGDPIKALREAVDNSFMGRLFGLGQVNSPNYREEKYYPEGTYPQQDIMALDPAGLPSTFDSFMSNFTPAGDIEAVAMGHFGLGGTVIMRRPPYFPLMMVPSPRDGGSSFRKHV